MRILALLLSLVVVLLANVDCGPPPAPSAAPPLAPALAQEVHPLAPQALSALGVVNVVGPVSCPAGAVAGAICTQVSVACPSVPPLSAQLIVSNPAGVQGYSGKGPTGTGVYTTGGPGVSVSPDEQLVIPSFTAAGFKWVQVVWSAAWEDIPSKSVAVAACRPATLFNWLDVKAHVDPTLPASRGFCLQGYSAGSSADAYALSLYGAAAFVDYAQMMSGPPTAAMDVGCSSAPGTVFTCNAVYGLGYEQIPRTYVNGWEGIQTCGTNPTANELAKLAGDSVLTAPGATFGYPNTHVGLITCGQLSSAAGMSALYETAVAGAGTPVHRVCVAPGACTYENVLATQAGRDQVVQDFLANCRSTR